MLQALNVENKKEYLYLITAVLTDGETARLQMDRERSRRLTSMKTARPVD